MKSLLIRLTHGLSEPDISENEQKFVQEWYTKAYLTYKNGVYKFHSKYRAGTLGLVQNNTAYLHVIGENVKDLLIEDIGISTEGDLIIAKRLLGKRGTPAAVIEEVVGREQTYSIGYIVQKENHRSLLDLKTDHPVGAELTPDELLSHKPGDVFKIDNFENKVIEFLGNIDDPKVDEKIVLAQFNKHDAFEEDVLEIAKSFNEVNASKYPKEKICETFPFVLSILSQQKTLMMQSTGMINTQPSM